VNTEQVKKMSTEMAPYRHVEIVKVEECAHCNQKLERQRLRSAALVRARRKAPMVLARLANFSIWNVVMWKLAIENSAHLAHSPGWTAPAFFVSIALVVNLWIRLSAIAKMELPPPKPKPVYDGGW
jgi:hypothetical protein